MARRLITALLTASLAVALASAAAAAEAPETPPPAVGGEGETTSTGSDCEVLDEDAIREAYAEAAVLAVMEMEKGRTAVLARADTLRAPLDALDDARTIEDVERAFAAAIAATNAYYDDFRAVFEAQREAVNRAAAEARERYLAACADEWLIQQFMEYNVDFELQTIDQAIASTEQGRATAVTELENERAAFLKSFQPPGDGDGGGGDDPGGDDPDGGDGGQGGDDPGDGPDGGDGGDEPGQGGTGNGGDGNADGGDDPGRLPFAGANALPLLVAGLTLVVAGAVTVVMTRRRRDRPAA